MRLPNETSDKMPKIFILILLINVLIFNNYKLPRRYIYLKYTKLNSDVKSLLLRINAVMIEN